MNQGQIIFEAAKLLGQLVGAIFVAWLTVRWALARYKQEKLWERRLGIYSEIIANLAEMRRTCEVLFEHHVRIHPITSEHEKVLGERYRAAKRRFEEAAAGASLTLPPRTIAVIQALQTALERLFTRELNIADAEDEEYGLLDKAIKELERFGREDVA
jgi:hypothetical protein